MKVERIKMFVVLPYRKKFVPAGILELENRENLFEDLKKNHYIDNDFEKDEIFIEMDNRLLTIYDDENNLLLYGYLNGEII